MKLTIEQCRQLLGEEAESMSDDDIETLLEHLSLSADVLIECYLKEKKHEKNPSQDL